MAVMATAFTTGLIGMVGIGATPITAIIPPIGALVLDGDGAILITAMVTDIRIMAILITATDTIILTITIRTKTTFPIIGAEETPITTELVRVEDPTMFPHAILTAVRNYQGGLIEIMCAQTTIPEIHAARSGIRVPTAIIPLETTVPTQRFATRAIPGP